MPCRTQNRAMEWAAAGRKKGGSVWTALAQTLPEGALIALSSTHSVVVALNSQFASPPHRQNLGHPLTSLPAHLATLMAPRAPQALLLLLLAAVAPRARAACRRLRANVTREEMFFNHRPLDLPQSHDLPTNFSWNDPNNTGVSMLVTAPAASAGAELLAAATRRRHRLPSAFPGRERLLTAGAWSSARSAGALLEPTHPAVLRLLLAARHHLHDPGACSSVGRLAAERTHAASPGMMRHGLVAPHLPPHLLSIRHAPCRTD